MSHDYEPINCSFYDELEIRAMRKQPCLIEFCEADHSVTTLVDTIVDVYSRKGEEFIQLASRGEVRLDRLVSVDGKRLESDV